MTDEVLDRFMVPRVLLCRGVPSDTVLPAVSNKPVKSGKDGPARDMNSKNQAKKLEKRLRAEEKKLHVGR